MSDRQDWSQEGTFVAGDGVSVSAYDDVFLVDSVTVAEQGSGGPFETVPAGSQATVLFFTTEEPVELDLECYVGDGSCFARAKATNVRFAIRGQDKHRND